MQTISNTSLDSVTGGGTPIPGGSSSATVTPTGTGTGTGTSTGTSTSCHDPLLGELSSLNQTLQQLSHKNNNGFDSNDMLMFGLAMAFSRPAAPGVVFLGGGGGGCRRGCW